MLKSVPPSSNFKRFAVVLWLVAFPLVQPASATEWIDEKGRVTSMVFPGNKPLYLAPDGHTIADGLSAFAKLCIETEFDREKAGAAAEALDWGFAYRQEMMPFKNPVDIGGWNSRSAALRVSNGIFFNELPQCNLVFIPEPAVDPAEVYSAMTALTNSPPANADRQFKKNGKPRKHWSPEWKIAGERGAESTVFVRPSSRFEDGFLISILQTKSPEKEPSS